MFGEVSCPEVHKPDESFVLSHMTEEELIRCLPESGVHVEKENLPPDVGPRGRMTIEEAVEFFDGLYSKYTLSGPDAGGPLQNAKAGNTNEVSEAGESEASGEVNEANGAGETNEADETKELTQEEINELQRKAIEEAFERIARGEELTDAEKGNLGEMLMDQYYIEQGYTPIYEPRVTGLSPKSGQGIDGVYERTDPDGSKTYIIADAKVNSSELKKGLADGTNQMSDAWVDKRLDNAVGKEKADEIRDAHEDYPSSVSKEVYHFSYGDSEDGTSSADVSTVDKDGNKSGDKEVVQTFDKYGDEIIGGDFDDKR